MLWDVEGEAEVEVEKVEVKMKDEDGLLAMAVRQELKLGILQGWSEHR